MSKMFLGLHCKFDPNYKWEICNSHIGSSIICLCRVLLAVPTNLCAGKAVERLIGKGFPPKQILHVIGEQAAATHGKAFKHPTVRVTNYEHNEEVQLIVATVQVMPRIFMLKVTIKGLFQKSALLIAVS